MLLLGIVEKNASLSQPLHFFRSHGQMHNGAVGAVCAE